MPLADYADAPNLEVAVGLELALPDPVRLWSGLGEVVWETNTFTGAGNLIEITEVGATSNIEARGVGVALSGVGADLLELALETEYQNTPATIWLWVVGDEGQLDGEVLFRGFADVMSMSEAGTTNRIELTLESQLARLDRAAVEVYSQEDLNRRFPGDKGLEYLEEIQDKEFVWGGDGPKDVRGTGGR